MVASFEFFEHTADVGLAVEADTLAELLVSAGEGIVQSLVLEPSTIRELIEKQFEVKAKELDFLLFDFLNELIYLFETERFLAARISAKEVSNLEWQFTLRGETFDSERHPSGHEVKAITYHGLSVEQRQGKWYARVILDI